MIKGTVKMIMPDFAPLIVAGTKLVTIRAPRKRPHKIGEILDWRIWTGKPYRSKMRHVAFSVVTDYAPITLHPEGFEMDGIFTPPPADLNKLAVEDGFVDWLALVFWFHSRYRFPFHAMLTRFRPLPVGGDHAS